VNSPYASKYHSRSRNASRKPVHPALLAHAVRCLRAARNNPTAAVTLLRRALNGAPLLKRAVAEALGN
jgi:hypothetical protein